MSSLTSDVVKVKFNNVVWPNGCNKPASFEEDIRLEFLKDADGVLFGYNDLVDIFKAYLQDEEDECPTSLDFSISPIGK